MPDLSLVILDLDGTLVDSRDVIIRVMRVAAERAGLPMPSDDATSRVIGLSLERAIQGVFPGSDPNQLSILLGAYKTEALRLRALPDDPEALFPGVYPTVQNLRNAGHMLGIATGKARRGVSHFCSRYEMEGWFDTVQTPDTNPSKPHPGMIESALSDTGATPERTIMVGDTVFDIEMARNAGVFGIGVAWGNHPVHELERAGAHHIVEKVEDLPKVIAEILA